MNDVTQLIFGRRSIRLYTPEPVGDEAVLQLLEAAMAAPSAMAKDPWRFVVVRERQTLKQMAQTLPGGQMLATSAVGIVVAGDLENTMERQVGYLVQDCSAAIENLLLCAHGLGLGACWVGVYPNEAQCRTVRDFFGMPGSIVPVAVISVGHPGESLPSRTRFRREYVRFEKW
jgi:nitroreductase